MPSHPFQGRNQRTWQSPITCASDFCSFKTTTFQNLLINRNNSFNLRSTNFTIMLSRTIFALLFASAAAFSPMRPAMVRPVSLIPSQKNMICFLDLDSHDEFRSCCRNHTKFTDYRTKGYFVGGRDHGRIE